MKRKIKIVLVFFICIAMILTITAIGIQTNVIHINLLQTTDDVEKQDEYIEPEKQDEYIEPINHPPTASFTYTNNLFTVAFIDESSDIDGDELQYEWDFGDGVTSTNQNPTHTYDCSDTNSFDITLTVSDGEYTDIFTEHILFGSNLNIIDYSQVWTGYDSYADYYSWDEDYIVSNDGPIWIGDISMVVENTGNIPAEISYAYIKTKEMKGDYSLFQGSIHFSFTYTYEEVVDGEEDGDGLKSEIVITVISNNTLTLYPGETVTLTSNPELTCLTWGVGTYPVNIWLFEKIKGKDRSHTIYDTIVYLE